MKFGHLIPMKIFILAATTCQILRLNAPNSVRGRSTQKNKFYVQISAHYFLHALVFR